MGQLDTSLELRSRLKHLTGKPAWRFYKEGNGEEGSGGVPESKGNLRVRIGTSYANRGGRAAEMDRTEVSGRKGACMVII